MSTVQLDLGGVPTSLTVSDKLLAVAPKPGAGHEFDGELATTLNTATSNMSALGPYSVADISSVASTAGEGREILKASPVVGDIAHVYHTSSDGVPFVPTGTIFVRFAAEGSPADVQQLIGSLKAEVVEARGERTLILRSLADGPDAVEVSSMLQGSKLVEVAEPDFYSEAESTSFVFPSDQLMCRQWHLDNTGFHHGTALGFKKGADARITKAWQTSQCLGDPSVVVAIIDDGFDLTHPDISGADKVVAPWDFKRSSSEPLPDYLAGDWHGTACAGVAVGNADTVGIVGAAPACRLMPIRWGASLSDDQIEKWFDWAVDNGAAVISCSWSPRARNYPLSTRKQEAIARASENGRGGLGCVIVFAAGNDNRNVFDPEKNSINGFACHPNVITVSASTSQDVRATYSNFGDHIAVSAPSSGAGGWRITTADVIGTYVRNGQISEAGYSAGSYTDEFGGTSSACPLVAGICALLLSINPLLRSSEIKSILTDTARKIGEEGDYSSSGHSHYFGYGCVDADAAVRSVLNRIQGEKPQAPSV
ncbi:Calcium-dependent protease [Methylobacterium tardum]|uniref:S8 family peptidase n=1 Tax=Methylobacterium tardum TaxID=374432 RepID=UPI001EDF27C2|nr:S8 family serine peptidase [Methylobacterium tardum]URD34582.1 S8 family serine peptidase [Methylobacterium tardum]GJE48414.1 Calcium-dependent protease [Methylobacterium tardum]